MARMHTAPLQSELTLTQEDLSRDPDYYFANKLISRVQRELAEKRRYLIGIASRWLTAYDYACDLHSRWLSLDDPSERETRYFLGVASMIEGLGRMLVQRIADSEADIEGGLGVKVADISACVEHLSDIHRAATLERSPVVAAEIDRLFGCAGRS